MDISSIKEQQQMIRETGNKLLNTLAEIKLIAHQGLPLTTETLMKFLGDVQKHQAKLTAITQEVLTAYQAQQPPKKTYTLTLLEPKDQELSDVTRKTIQLGDVAYVFEQSTAKE